MWSHESAPGFLRGRWRVHEEIARGGWAVVHRGSDSDGRTAAIKLLNVPSSPRETDEARTRFRREASLLRRLQHPHLVSCLDSDPDADPPWLALEWLPGPNLHQRVRASGPQAIEDVLRWGAEAAGVLAFLHGRGVLHRDLKPSNFSLDESGRLKLLDLGLATDPESPAGLTAPGAFLGSVGFAAPEVAAGQSATAASDLYGLGTVLYWCLTARPPLDGTTDRTVLRRQARDTAPSPSLLRPGIPPSLSAIVRSLLEIDPGDRPRSAEEVGRAMAELRAAPHPPPVHGRPQGAALQQTDPTVIKGTPLPPGAPDGAASPPRLPSEPLPRLGPYELVRRLGQGGMGEVYLARDPALRREVAIKVLPPWLGERPELTARFEREAQALAALRHEGVLAIHSVGREDGRPYLVTDYLPGESLEERLRRDGSIPPREAAEIIGQAADAVSHAHERGILHRDVKPANLLLTRREDRSVRVVVVDFGLAGRVEGPGTLTRSGDLFGTPAYMAPEQASAAVSRIGKGTDVYGLGATLYALLVGKPPHPGDTVWRILQHAVSGEVESLGRLRPDLHVDLVTIVERCLRPEATRRYPTASELRDDLRAYLQGEPIRARPPSIGYRAWRRMVRHRNVVVPLTAAILAIAGGLAYPDLREAWRARRDRLARADRERTSHSLMESAERALRDGALTEAEETARRIVSEFGAVTTESHPVPEAHAILASVLERKGERKQALRERFRAHVSAIGRDGEEAFLVRMAEERLNEGEFEQARTLLTRAGEQTASESLRAEVDYLLGRAAEGLLSCDEGLARIERSLAGPLPQALRSEAERHRDFCASLAGRLQVALSPNSVAVTDLDGDGRQEIVVGADRVVVVGGVSTGGTWRERARYDFPAGTPWNSTSVAAADLDGDGAPEILAAGGTPAAEGRFSILKAIEGRLEEQAGVALASAIGRLPFAVGDLDGDGDPEILLGTATYERSIRVYTWRRGASALELRSLTPARGDVARILLQDLDADGTPEAIAGAGPWGAYALQVYAWRGNKLVLRSQVTAGTIGSADEVPGGEGWEILAAVLWEPEQVRPLEHLLGEDRFRKTYRPPGLYSARPDGQGGMGLTPVLAGEWANISSGLWKTAIVRGRRGPQAWLIGKDDPPATGPASSATRTWSGAVLERSTSGLWTPVVKFTHPDSVLPYLGAADLDGDGEDELLLSSDQGLLIRGLGRRDPPPPAVGRRQGSPNRSGEGEEAVTRSLLDAARDAEQAGLWEEALEVYRRVGERPGRGSTSLDIFGGVRRCLAALGCYEELSEAAKRTSAEHPGREAEILTPPIEALCEARRWGIAADLVALRGQSAGLDASARVAARVEERRLRDLEALPARLALCGSDGAALDWLVSSPLAVHINGESLTFSSSSDTREFCVTAVRMDGPGAEISATAEPGALDWATEVGLSLHYEPPWVKMSGVSGEQFNWATHEAAEIGFRSSGSTSFPRRRVTLVANGPAWGFEQILLEDRGGLPRRIRLTLQPLPSPSRLYGRVAWEDRDDRKAGLFEAAGPASSPRGGRVWVGLSGSGSHSGPGFWGTVLFAGLEFRSPRTSDVPIPYTAVSALDHLLLANGRQVWGRSDEARRLYDLAVRLSESEAAREERLIAEGLPSSWTGGTAYAHWRWVHVDALMYRGLLRSNLGDSAGAAEDLRRAWKRGPERVAQLTARFARPLLKRPMESEALAALWLRGEGEETPPPDAEAVLERIRATYDATGEVDEWIEALFGRFGYRVRHGLTVKRTEAPEGPTRSGPQAGDRVESADHAPIRTRSDWTTARMRAAREGADAMRVIFRRGDQTVEVSVPIERPDIELEEKATVEGPDAVGR